MSLPKGYKRLEYIQSSGTQYIDTGIVANGNTRLVADIQSTATANAARVWFGARRKGTNSFMCGNNTRSSYAVSAIYGTKNTSFSLTLDEYNTRRTVDFNKNSLIFSTGQSYEFTAQTFEMDITLDLFGANDPDYGGHRLLCEMRLYSCQIYDNGTLVRDFIPCQNADGAVGLWDDANGVFYGNAGTGTFTAGPFIQAPGKPSGLAHALSVRLVWSAVSGAASYNIYRDGAFVGSSNTPTFVDVSAAENQTYVYAVSAVGQGVEGEPATLTVYTKAGYFEYKPLIESANFQ